VKALVIGGTAFLGIHVTHELRDRGHEVTHFNRGRTNPNSAPGVRTVIGDRTAGFDALEAERFDAVVDTCGYLPPVVERSARFFAGRTGRYVFVSSISVYDDHLEEGFEDSPMPPLAEGASVTELAIENYGPLKALCERVVASTFRGRATIVRPGLIAGPNDRTDRFTYWPVRFDRGGEILAPGVPGRAVQFVDVRDLARFVVHLVERGAGGDYNVTSPQGAFTMGGVMEACAAAARTPGAVTWVDDEFLTAQGVAPWMDLPLWIPPSENMPGFMNYNVRKALTAGLTIRPLEETVRDTLAWARTRPKDHEWRAGLTAARETELLQSFRAS
jgi:2'-hydroxyisoflavone reductase